MKPLRLFLFILLSGMAMSPVAATLDDVRTMIQTGDLGEALSVLDSISSKQKKNSEVDLLLGQCYVALNNDDAAVKAFQEARTKGSHQAMLELAEIAIRQYRVADADQLISDYKAFIQKNKRKKLVDESDTLNEKLIRTRNMLDRVEKIAVIDSFTVDKYDFFSAYRISPESGSLNSPDILPDNFGYAEPTVVYKTEDGREMIWAAADDDGRFHLKATNLLADNTWEEPEPVGDDLGGDGDANYPFLMPDGISLYFASDNSESLGGYDIFISRNNGSRFLQPQNVGMPYNSPYDDYMLAIDEKTGAGWWASDRNRLGDSITVYVFIPSDLRVNVPVDDPNLAGLARLSSIKDTWQSGADYSSLLASLEAIKPKNAAVGETFAFALPDGRVAITLSDFRNPQAAEAMGRYLSLKADIDADLLTLASLRADYAGGDTSVSQKILTLENGLKNRRRELKRIANDVIKAEIR